jgi:hypothetical protein
MIIACVEQQKFCLQPSGHLEKLFYAKYFIAPSLKRQLSALRPNGAMKDAQVLYSKTKSGISSPLNLARRNL